MPFGALFRRFMNISPRYRHTHIIQSVNTNRFRMFFSTAATVPCTTSIKGVQVRLSMIIHWRDHFVRTQNNNAPIT